MTAYERKGSGRVGRRRSLLFALALALLLAATLLIPFRRHVLLWIYAALVAPPPLLEPTEEGPGVRWFDDYYTVERIDEQTIAIGEPRYAQQVFSYLILGQERAVLFDSGPGLRDIRPVVEALTALPVTAVPSHLHYDHVGNHDRFDSVAVVDLPHLRERAQGGVLRPTRWEHLGFTEDVPVPELRVTEWLAPGALLELGGRSLEVLHVPGHTRESIALFDREREQLFSGDFIYPGPLVAMVPGSSMGDYLRTAERLAERLPASVALLTAHRSVPPGAPVLAYGDLVDLRGALDEIRQGEREGSGVFPRVFRVNERMLLWSDFWESWN